MGGMVHIYRCDRNTDRAWLKGSVMSQRGALASSERSMAVSLHSTSGCVSCINILHPPAAEKYRTDPGERKLSVPMFSPFSVFYALVLCLATHSAPNNTNLFCILAKFGSQVLAPFYN